MTRARALLDQALAAEREELAGRTTTTTPGSARRCWTICRAPPPARWTSCPPTTGRAPKPRSATRRSSTGCAVRCSTSASPGYGTPCVARTRPSTRPPTPGCGRCSPTSTRCSPRTPGARTPPTSSPSSCAGTASSSRSSRPLWTNWWTRWPVGRPPPNGCCARSPRSSSEELSRLMARALGDSGLAGEMAALNDNLRALRPDLAWNRREQVRGEQPLAYGEATGALGEIADLDDLLDQLGQEHPGATLDDIDVETVRAQPGPGRRRRRAPAARAGARTAPAGLADRGGGAPHPLPEGAAPARRHRTAPGLRAPGERPARPARPRLRRRGRRDHRRLPPLGVR